MPQIVSVPIVKEASSERLLKRKRSDTGKSTSLSGSLAGVRYAPNFELNLACLTKQIGRTVNSRGTPPKTWIALIFQQPCSACSPYLPEPRTSESTMRDRPVVHPHVLNTVAKASVHSRVSALR